MMFKLNFSYNCPVNVNLKYFSHLRYILYINIDIYASHASAEL